MGGQDDVIQVVLATLQSYQVENRDGLKRVHERLDLLIGRDYVPREDCERYRQLCKACVKDEIKKVDDNLKAEIKKVGGYPAWVVVICSILSGIVVGIAVRAVG